MSLGICPACENERTLDRAGRIDFHLTRDADGCLDVCEGVRHEPLPPKPDLTRPLAGGPASPE